MIFKVTMRSIKKMFLYFFIISLVRIAGVMLSVLNASELNLNNNNYNILVKFIKG